MAECYYRTNALINVDYIKIDTELDNTFDESLKKVGAMQYSTILQKDFDESEKGNKGSQFSPNAIQAKYFSPELIDSGVVYNIYRKTPFQKYYDYICTLNNGANSLLDYNIVNNQYYWVQIFSN